MQKLPPAPRAGRGAGGRGRLGRRRHDSAPEVYAVTTARTGQHDDVNKRARRYMVSMTIRLVCLVLAFVFFGSWEAWVFAAGAVVLPYVAVIMANSGRERPASPPTAMMSPEASRAGQGAPQPQPVRSIGAVPPRTTPAPDPWADPRTAPRPAGPARAPRTGGAGSWQHSYAPPGEHTTRTARAS